MKASALAARNREALHAGDAAAFTQLYAGDAEIVGPGGRVMRGPAGARQFFEFRRASKLELVVENETVHGATLTLEGTAYASPPAPSVASPKNKLVIARFVETFVVEDGLIRAHRLVIDEAYRIAPWEIGRPQSSVVELERDGFLTGRVLDVGCGTGENALFLASAGCDVVGIDASQFAIEKARTKAREREHDVEFVCADALALPFDDESFDNVIDSGLLHVLAEKDHDRFTGSLHRVLRSGGCYHVLCLNERAAIPGPRRLTKADLESIFARDWVVESIRETTIDVKLEPGRTAADASAWLARVRRV